MICPGHVSAVIRIEPYHVLAEKYDKPCVITGFETLDILEGIVMLLRQLHKNEARVEIQYRRVVKEEGNPVALATLENGYSGLQKRAGGVWALFPAAV